MHLIHQVSPEAFQNGAHLGRAPVHLDPRVFRAGLDLPLLGLLERDAHAFGDRLGDGAAAEIETPREEGLSALVEREVGGGVPDVQHQAGFAGRLGLVSQRVDERQRGRIDDVGIHAEQSQRRQALLQVLLRDRGEQHLEPALRGLPF